MRPELKRIVGSLAAVAVPSLLRDIEAGKNVDKHSRLKHAILDAKLDRASRNGDDHAVQATLHAKWQHRVTDQYYTNTLDRFDEWFLGPHYRVVEALVSQSFATNPAYQSLIEIGCGGGQALSHYAQMMPGLKRLTGLDINPAIIERNHTTYKGQPRLAFECANALTRVPELLGPHTILTTYGGVLEYFSQAELAVLFEALASHSNTALAIVEPVDETHDFATQPDSFVHGGENSFSHNYPHIVEQAGLEVRYVQEDRTEGYRFVMMMAVSP